MLYHRARHLREQSYSSVMQPRAHVNNERALVVEPLDSQKRTRPILGLQPLALGAAPIRYTMSVEEITEGSKLVPIEYYVEEEPTTDINTENMKTKSMGRYNMDANTMFFIASGGVKPVFATSQKFPNQPLRPCLKCSGPH